MKLDYRVTHRDKQLENENQVKAEKEYSTRKDHRRTISVVDEGTMQGTGQKIILR